MQITDQIRQLNIADTIGKYVKLQRKGSVMVGCCPFHNEKTPSFTVFEKTGTWKCFGCGEGGDLITFVMKHNKLQFTEAIEQIAADNGLEYKQLTQEQKQQHEAEYQKKQAIINVLRFAADYYYAQTQEDDGTQVRKYIQERAGQMAEAFKIGYAREGWSSLLDEAKKQGYGEQILHDAGLIRKSEKTKQYYDYFRNRIMLPIHSSTGTVIGFCGRTMSTEKKEAKYINSPDGPLYNKSRVWYGLHQAQRQISISDSVYIVEGNFDVVQLHRIGVSNAVAPCGTSVTGEHIQSIIRYSKNIVLMFDGDAAGNKATYKVGEAMMEVGANVKVVQLPQDKDPADSFIMKEAFEKYAEGNTHSFLCWMTNQELHKAGTDPVKKSTAINHICKLLALIKDDTTRQLYVEDLASRYDIKQKTIHDRLKMLNKEQVQELQEGDEPLPPGVDAASFANYGFYEYKNQYWFNTRDGRTHGGNFIMEPLFHIKSVNDARRLYKLTNVYGRNDVVEFDMQAMTSLQAFRKVIEGVGNYLWEGTDAQFMKVKRKLYEETPECIRIDNLGWQKEGFFAWSNGIVVDGHFDQVDEYGIVHHNSDNYFIPAYSSNYINDKSVYINERKFMYEHGEVDMIEWCSQFCKVYGRNGMIGTAFWLATLFRDIIFNTLKFFPILNHFGPPGGGKSQMAISMLYLFGQPQTNVNVNNVTKVAISEHIAEFNNALAWCDEFKNDIEPDKVQILKAVYDGIGRKRGTISQGKKTEVTKVDCGMLLTGQQMTTADVALFTRVVLLEFCRSKFTDNEKIEFSKLQRIQEKGLSHLTVQVLKHRNIIERHFFTEYNDVCTELTKSLKDDDIEDRIMRNMATLLTVYKLLHDYIDFGFSYSDIYKEATRSIRFQNNEIMRSNEVSVFWSMVEYLLNDNLIEVEKDFDIKNVSSITVDTNMVKHFDEPKQVLFLKFSRIYKLYAEHGKRSSQTILPEQTIKYYLGHSREFLCTTRRKKFNTGVSSAYCFDYSKLSDMVNLVQSTATDEMDDDYVEEAPISTAPF